MKQSQKFWAKNDLNLLADVSYDVPPQDIFKQTHVPKQGIKEVPTKPNMLTHCSDEALMKEAEIASGYRNKVSWSTQTTQHKCIGDDRVFDKIVKMGLSKENAEHARQ